MTFDRDDRLRRTRTVRRSLVVGAVAASLGVTAACGLATQSITASGSSGTGTQSGQSGRSGTNPQRVQQGQSLQQSQQQSPQSPQGQTFQQAPPPQPGSGSAPQAQSSGS